DRCSTGVRSDQRREHAQGRRLTGSVRAEEAEDLTFTDVQVDAAHGFDRSDGPALPDLECFSQGLGFDHGRLRGAGSKDADSSGGYGSLQQRADASSCEPT